MLVFFPLIYIFLSFLPDLSLVLVLHYFLLVLYYRDILTLHDGGEVALDWGSNKDLSQSLSSPERRDLPVLLVIPGISGCSQSAYVKHLVQDGLIAGYRPIVFNQRGNGGIRLKVGDVYTHIGHNQLDPPLHINTCYALLLSTTHTSIHAMYCCCTLHTYQYMLCIAAVHYTYIHTCYALLLYTIHISIHAMYCCCTLHTYPHMPRIAAVHYTHIHTCYVLLLYSTHTSIHAMYCCCTLHTYPHMLRIAAVFYTYALLLLLTTPMYGQL